MKNKWKIIIIVFDIIAICLFSFKYYIDSKKFYLDGLKYDIPNGLKYIRQENYNMFDIIGKENLMVKVSSIRRDLTKYNTTDELYNSEEKIKDDSKLKLDRKNIFGIDMVVFNYLNEKKITYAFISKMDYCYTVDVYYSDEEFDINSLYDVFESLNNATIK